MPLPRHLQTLKKKDRLAPRRHGAAHLFHSQMPVESAKPGYCRLECRDQKGRGGSKPDVPGFSQSCVRQDSFGILMRSFPKIPP
jgi:hypothetical protein